MVDRLDSNHHLISPFVSISLNENSYHKKKKKKICTRAFSCIFSLMPCACLMRLLFSLRLRRNRPLIIIIFRFRAITDRPTPLCQLNATTFKKKYTYIYIHNSLPPSLSSLHSSSCYKRYSIPPPVIFKI